MKIILSLVIMISACWMSAPAQVTFIKSPYLSIGTKSSHPSHFITFKNLTYFYVSSSAHQGLWRSDGTESGTFRVIPDIRVDEIVSTDSLIFISGRQQQAAGLFISDGTAAGTSHIAGIKSPSGSFSPSHLTPTQNKVYFWDMLEGTSAAYLWVTDGRLAGTKVLSAALECSSSPVITTA